MTRFRAFARLFALTLTLLILTTSVVSGQPLVSEIAEHLDDPEQPEIHLPLVGSAMSFPLLPPTPEPVAPHPGLALAAFHTDDFSGPAQCDNCHSNLKDQAGVDVTNSSDWRSTMMANAARDPLYLAKVSSEIERNKDFQALIEATCSRCHMPMAYTQAKAAGKTPAIFGDGFLDPANEFHEAAMDGVSCTLCHQIQPDGLGEEASFDGHFVIDTSTQPPDRALFGPYPDPDSAGRSIMRLGAGYDPQQGLHLTKSGLCASCHTLRTPYINAEGGVSTFPEQMAFFEWTNSDYGDGQAQEIQCQGCHLPQADGGVSLFPGWPEREPFYKHYFVGGNVFMLKILQANVEEMGLRASTDQFQQTIERTATQLQERTAQLSNAGLAVDGDLLTAKFRIDVQTGHKFPTGYPSRRAWLHVTVSDSSGRLIFDSGRPLAHGGVNGNDADLAPGAYEPHYDVITRPDQVQIYETIMGDIEGELTHTLLEAASYLKDNRLLPAGFDKTAVPPEIGVLGGAAADENFQGGHDQITYQIDVGGFTGPFTVAADLLYQTASYPFVQDLRSDPTSPVVRFGELFDRADKTPVIIDSMVLQTP